MVRVEASNWRTASVRLGNGKGGLVGEWCPVCEQTSFPPRDYCPVCLTHLGRPPLPGETIVFFNPEKETPSQG